MYIVDRPPDTEYIELNMSSGTVSYIATLPSKLGRYYKTRSCGRPTALYGPHKNGSWKPVFHG